MSYAAQSDIEDIFTPANVAAWSLFETGTPSGAADPTRIATALALADAQINAFFIGGPYQVPLAWVFCKPGVIHWAAVIAGVCSTAAASPPATSITPAIDISLCRQRC